MCHQERTYFSQPWNVVWRGGEQISDAAVTHCIPRLREIEIKICFRMKSAIDIFYIWWNPSRSAFWTQMTWTSSLEWRMNVTSREKKCQERRESQSSSVFPLRGFRLSQGANHFRRSWGNPILKKFNSMKVENRISPRPLPRSSKKTYSTE